MGVIDASALQAIINSTPLSQFQIAYRLDSSFLFGVLGGPQVHSGNFQIHPRTAGNDSVGAFAGTTDLTTAGSSSRDRVTLNIKRYKATFGSDGLEEALVAGNAYDLLTDIIAEESSNAMEDLFNLMNADLIKSGSGIEFNGVPYYVATGSGLTAVGNAPSALNTAYGDKTRGKAYSSYVFNAETASLTLGMMDAVHTAMVDDRSSAYDSIWCSEQTIQKVEQLLRASGSQYLTVVNDSADARFRKIAYAGRPITAIPGYPNARLDFTVASDWSFWSVPQVSLDQTGREVSGIWKIENLAKTTDSAKFALITYGNLVNKNPWRSGLLISFA